MRYIFEGYELDTKRRELRSGATLISIEPQVFDLLEYVIRNRDHVVSKEEVLATIWNGRAVSDSALTSRVNAARKAIGDSGEDQRLIRTLRRKGIRFVGAVKVIETAEPGPTIGEAPMQSGLVLPGNPSIAVLPFTNLSNDPAQDYFADGMAEDITMALGRLPWLFVIASASAFTYKGHPADPRHVGRDLGVRYVMRGSIRKDGNRVRVAVQLTDASDGRQFWTERFDGELDGLFSMQDQVAAQVSAMIAPTLRSREIERARRKPTSNLTAYDLYLRALPPHRDTFAQNQESIRLLDRAVELDPAFGAAYGLLAFCHLMQVVFSWETPGDSVIQEGIRLARLAAEHGENDPEALWMAGRTLSALAGEFDRGAALIEKSISLNPNSARAWWASGMTQAYLGCAETAIDHFMRARRLNPIDTSGHAHWSGMALAYLFSGDYQSARQAIDRALIDWPTSLPSLRAKAAICGLVGALEEGQACVQELRSLSSNATIAAFVALNQLQMKCNPSGLNRFVEGLRKSGLPEG